MILNTAPQNEAILSNVGEIGEFRIRNSAKAFNILSSGLYANKIRAIIRELSCNAVDSHVAAGKADVSFDVYLPTALEPFFRIRDYGTGLDHEQVTNIYTTYFESTKTGSNDFIGALGLGSKSPFSYTDNFTVTAIKDGRKGIYSAFINSDGVPSIALMMEEQTDEPAGVEIQFSVNDKTDFYKFRDEARSVYRFFKLKPEIKNVEFTFEDIEYETRDLIPGVHTYKDSYRSSVAVMGNIAYPIDIPNEDQLGELRQILKCGLEMHFDIGELDFQASREGLSYIPQTIESIKKKLELVRGALSDNIKTEAEKIDNFWTKTDFLERKVRHPLWSAAVHDYVSKSNIPTVSANVSAWQFIKANNIDVDVLASKYNISIVAFDYSPSNNRCTSEKPSSEYRATTGFRHEYFNFAATKLLNFVINDLKIGAAERAKYHYRKNSNATSKVYVLSRADKNKEMNTKQFFADIYNPPESQIFTASLLDQKPREQSSVARNVSILRIENRSRNRNSTRVWADAGKLNGFSDQQTHYYIPLSGYQTISKIGGMDAKDIQTNLRNSLIPELQNIEVYGVRKTDIEVIKTKSNWINIEDHLTQFFNTPNENVLNTIVRSRVTLIGALFESYSTTVRRDIDDNVDVNSNFRKVIDFHKTLSNTKKGNGLAHIAALSRVYGNDPQKGLYFAAEKVEKEYNALCAEYPMLEYMNSSYGNEKLSKVILDYVNLIDKTKGI
jgi:hypothetical protein